MCAPAPRGTAPVSKSDPTNSAGTGVPLLFLLTPGHVGPPTGGPYSLGSFWVDFHGTLWQCVVAGSPGTWVNLTAGSKFVPLAAPVCCYDSRPG